MKEVAAGGGGEGTGHAGETPEEPTNEQAGDPQAGESVWTDNCAGCHGLDGTGGNGGPNLTAIESAKDASRVRAQITNGGGGMPSFKDSLTEKQISDTTAYVVQRITNK
jgi:mono/diheme cytochrome c family protein